MSGSSPTSWATAAIGDICKPVSKRGPDATKASFRYVDLSSIDRATKSIANATTIDTGSAPSRAKQVLASGDALFSNVRVYLENIAQVPDSLDGEIGSTAFCVLRPAGNIDPRYLYHFVTSRKFVLAVDALQRGNSPPSVQDSDVRQQMLPIAPSKEQRRIVSKIDELFSRIDEGEQALKRVEKLVERYRQSVLKAAVTGELTRDWRAARKRAGGPVGSGAALLARILEARRTAWEAAELAKMNAKRKPPTDDRWKQKYKEPQPPDTTDLPELPEGWVWASMDQLSRSSSYGTSTKCVYDGVGVPVLRIPNIRGGHLDFSDIKRANTDICTDADDLLSYGDLLVVRTNGSASLIGVGCVVTEPTPMPCYFASYLIRFRLALPTALSAWITLCWQSHVVRKFVGERKATSAGQYNISQSSLMELCLPLAPVAEMQEVVTTAARVASEADSAQACSINERRRSSALRQSILKAAFSGQLVPQDPSEEPAAKLLERIAAERAAAPAIRKRKKKSA